MRVINHTAYDTSVLTQLVKLAQQYVITSEEKVSMWGPSTVSVHEITITGVDAGDVTVSLDGAATPARVVARVAGVLSWWGRYIAGREAGRVRDPDEMTVLSVLEQAGIDPNAPIPRAEVVPVKLKPPPSPALLVGQEIHRLVARELRWKTKLKRATTALKKIARARARLDKKLAKLTGGP